MGETRKVTRVKYTRRGECNFKECKAACCRSLNKGSGSIKNDNDGDTRIDFVDHTCPHIERGFGCAIYDKRPSVCREFPSSPWDLIFARIEKVCGYWFEVEIEYDEELVSDLPSPSPVEEEENVGVGR